MVVVVVHICLVVQIENKKLEQLSSAVRLSVDLAACCLGSWCSFKSRLRADFVLVLNLWRFLDNQLSHGIYLLVYTACLNAGVFNTVKVAQWLLIQIH